MAIKPLLRLLRTPSLLLRRAWLRLRLGRFGDDEFVVIAPGDAGGIVALRLRDAIAELPPVGETTIKVSGFVTQVRLVAPPEIGIAVRSSAFVAASSSLFPSRSSLWAWISVAIWVPKCRAFPVQAS